MASDEQLLDEVTTILDEMMETPCTFPWLEDQAKKIIDMVRKHYSPTTSMYLPIPSGYMTEPATTTETVYQMCGCHVNVEGGQLVVDTCPKHTPRPREN